MRVALLLLFLLPTFIFADPPNPLPPSALQLQQKYRQAVEVAETPLRNQYITELTKLYDQAMKANKLSEAISLRAEINSMVALSMTGIWRDTSGIMYIYPNGTIRHSNGATGTWVIKGDDMLLSWSNGARHAFPIVKTTNFLRGRFNDSTELTLDRLTSLPAQ